MVEHSALFQAHPDQPCGLQGRNERRLNLTEN